MCAYLSCHRNTLLGGVFALLISLNPAYAEQGVYKWTDDQGNVHYGQVPPTDSNAQSVRTKAHQPDSESQQRLTEQLEAFEERQLEREAQKQATLKAEEEQAIKDRNCLAAKNNLKILQGNPRSLVKVGDSFQRLSEEQRQAKISEAKQTVEKFCN